MTQNATQTLLFVGSGDLARRIAPALRSPARCLGLCRRPERLPMPFEGLAGDYTHPDAFEAVARLAPDTVVLTLKPDGRDAEGYRRGFLAPVQHLLAALDTHRPRRLFFVSSTRVYAESDGGRVDESSPLVDDASPAGMIVAAERALLASGYPTTILRCAGLYGGAGGMLLERVARGDLSSAGPVRYGNRVHRDDVAGFIAWLIDRERRGQAPLDCYNVVDDVPAPQHEVEQWLAQAMGVTVGGDAGGEATGPARGHKRVDNKRLRDSGYQLDYPDFRSGYAAVLGLQRQGVATC